jgi:hypothetical protein
VGLTSLVISAGLLTQALLAQEPSGNSRHFVVYTQYNPTFVPKKSRIHFTVTAFVQNATTKDFKNVEFKRTFPEGFEPKTAPDAFQSVVRRPPEFKQGLEADRYTMFLPELWGGRGASVFYELHIKGRHDEVMMPGLEIQYDLNGGRLIKTMSGDLVHLKPYTYFTGSLRDFLKRNAQVSMDIGLKGDPWRMAPVDVKALGQNPAGITGITGDLQEGHFRLQSGSPGNFRDLLVVWWPRAKKKERVQQVEEVLKLIKKYSTWVGIPQVLDDSIKVTPDRRFKKFRGWYAEGLWQDDVPERYGGGPFASAIMYSSVADAEYLLLWWAQGRGMGLGRSDVPQPERDAALMHELEEIVDSFRPFRKH